MRYSVITSEGRSSAQPSLDDTVNYIVRDLLGDSTAGWIKRANTLRVRDKVALLKWTGDTTYYYGMDRSYCIRLEEL